jgi:hypothetical protein
MSWKSNSFNISIGYPILSKGYITTCARRAHSELAKIAHACTAFDFAVHTERTRNGDRRKTEIGKLAAELRGLTFFDDLPEVRCQLTIVTGKHLIQVPLGPDRRLQSPLFTLGGFGFVLLCFRFKISHGGATPRNTRTTFDSTLTCAEKKAANGNFYCVCRSPDQFCKCPLIIGGIAASTKALWQSNAVAIGCGTFSSGFSLNSAN